MRTRVWLTRACVLLGVMVVGACASLRGGVEDDGGDDGGVPTDFALGVTVLSGQQDPELNARLVRWRRPVRHVIEADWLLRSAVGVGVNPDVFPAGVRQLRREQVERLWRDIQSSGLLRKDHPSSIAQVQGTGRAMLGSVAIISITHDGRVDARRVSLGGRDADTLAAATLLDHLAALAWIRE